MVQPSTICAVGINNSKQAPCFGDNGGALVINEINGWTQIGIASFHHALGCESGNPAGFVRVTSALDWISSVSSVPIRPW